MSLDYSYYPSVLIKFYHQMKDILSHAIHKLSNSLCLKVLQGFESVIF